MGRKEEPEIFKGKKDQTWCLIVRGREGRGRSQDDSQQLPSLQGKREEASSQLGHQLPWTQITLGDPAPSSSRCSL
jgi:hypothetical protein